MPNLPKSIDRGVFKTPDDTIIYLRTRGVHRILNRCGAAHGAREKFSGATPIFLGATPIFQIRCGAEKNRCGAKKK